MEHRAVIAGLTGSEREQLLEKSDAAGLGQLAGHLAAIAVTTAAVLKAGPLRPLFMVGHGVLVGFLFTALHETVHHTPFKTRWVNDLVGRACGAAVFIAPRWFRHFHMAHHRHTNDPERDPELAHPRPATRWQYALYISGVPDWAGRIRTLVANAAMPNTDSFVPDRAKAAVKVEARAQIGFYLGLAIVSVGFGSTVLVRVWLVPLVLGGPALRAYLLAEHAGCAHVESMFKNTRTTFTNRVVRRLAWNMPYHVEHHTFPGVPFHRLGTLHDHLGAHLAVTERGYLRFNRRFAASLPTRR